MHRVLIALPLLALGVFGWQQEARDEQTFLRLDEEQMIVEYTATSGEAVLLVTAETEGALGLVQIRGPDGRPMLRMRSQSKGDFALQGFMVETRETSCNQLFRRYEEGLYDLSARTVEGRPVLGSAELSHVLPVAPQLVYPADGATGVSPHNLTVSWVSDPGASGYHVGLEQDENDGLVADLPAGSNSFQVPPGILKAGTTTHLEVGAVGENGNRTLVELTFTTRG